MNESTNYSGNLKFETAKFECGVTTGQAGGMITPYKGLFTDTFLSRDFCDDRVNLPLLNLVQQR